MVKERKGVVIAVTATVLAVLCLLALVLVFTVGARGEPPVIYGVQGTIARYTDDDILAALTDGVYAADQEGNTFPVEIAVYDESGELVAEYDESTGNETKYQAGTYRVVYSCKSAQEVESALVLQPEDKEPPVIKGAKDLTVTVGGTISYRDGVTVTDNMDENVQLQVDAGQVNLDQAGTYPVTYSAEDSRGNKAEVTVTVLVEEAPEEPPAEDPPEPGHTTEPTRPVDTDVTQETLDKVAAGILAKIIKPNMTMRQQARAIFDYVRSHMRYVGTSDKSSWVKGAYVGFTQKKGDCFNYFACCKELLTLAGIPNIDLQRVGGTTRHYWSLVNVGDGWYHFDTCPHPTGYSITTFLLTEAQVREYTARVSAARKNYYVYDYDACPVTVVGTPEEEIKPQQPPVEQPSKEPPVGQPSEQPPVEQPSEEPPVEQPSEQPPVEQPSEEPPAEQPSEEPSVEQPSEDPPAEGAPGTEPEQPSDTSGQVPGMSGEEIP